ncbi:hypothetical protein ACJX0J_034070, partial [Zea mays]
SLQFPYFDLFPPPDFEGAFYKIFPPDILNSKHNTNTFSQLMELISLGLGVQSSRLGGTDA